MPRELVQHADNLRKFEGRHDSGLARAWRLRVLGELGPSSWEHLNDRFAATHNAISARYCNALFDALDVEAADAFGQGWSSGQSYLIPPFTYIGAVLEKIQ